MAGNSKIEWTDHTFNPWIGCTKMSPGCEHCYAETLMDTRYGRVRWGKGNPRLRTSAANWKLPLRWDRAASCGREQSGVRPRVFCASLADWLDDEIPIEWFADLLNLILETPFLDWLLLTKRPKNWKARIEAAADSCPEREMRSTPAQYGYATLLYRWLDEWLDGSPPANVWLGTTVEDQTRADSRIPALLSIPAKVRFLSCEPLLGPVNIEWALSSNRVEIGANFLKLGHFAPGLETLRPLDWVIAGGESGPHARPMHPDWARSLRDQCQAAQVPFLFKQWGEWVRDADIHTGGEPSKPVFDEATFSNGTPAPLGYRRMYKVGKKAAGRKLDGREWNEFPEVR